MISLSQFSMGSVKQSWVQLSVHAGSPPPITHLNCKMDKFATVVLLRLNFFSTFDFFIFVASCRSRAQMKVKPRRSDFNLFFITHST